MAVVAVVSLVWVPVLCSVAAVIRRHVDGAASAVEESVSPTAVMPW